MDIEEIIMVPNKFGAPMIRAAFKILSKKGRNSHLYHDRDISM